MESKKLVQSKIIDDICAKEKISLYVWIGVVIYQVIAGLLFFGYDTLIIAAINAFGCFQSYKFVQKIKENPVGVYKHYKDSLISSIIFIAINLWIGGFIGVIGAIYDITIRQFVMKNKDEILELEAVYSEEETVEATV